MQQQQGGNKFRSINDVTIQYREGKRFQIRDRLRKLAHIYNSKEVIQFQNEKDDIGDKDVFLINSFEFKIRYIRILFIVFGILID